MTRVSQQEDPEARAGTARPLSISRRAFVGIGVGAAAAAALGSPAMARAGGATDGDSHDGPVPDFDLSEVSIDRLAAGLASGSWTSRELCERYIARIEQVDRGGPRLRSVLQLNPDALAIAASLDRERASGRLRGPLHGIPVLIKDNIDTRDRMTTAAGSLALAHGAAPRDAHVAERLRAAGAIILGKTNLSEWANFRSTHSTSGWSGMGGQTRNPYALDRTPSGSSSGSGAAAAASLCAAAVGTETNGSITSPAAAQGLVGIKPTVGLVSRSGIIPIAHTQDTAGPMARTVRDAAILLGALAGADPRDPATATSAGHVHGDYTRFLDPRGLRGARIGVARKRYFGYSPAADRIAEDALDVLRREGAILVDPAEIPTAATLGEKEFDLLLYEFKHDLNAYLAERAPAGAPRTLAELIRFNEEHRAQEMPFFGQEIFVRAEAKGPLTDPGYREALEVSLRRAREEGIDAVLRRHKLDALVAPTQGPPGLIDLVNGNPRGGGSVTSPAAIAGYPHITVPAGFVFGLPVGLSFFGAAWSEPTLIRLAYAFEQATRVRRAPGFVATAPLGAGV